MHYHVAHSDSLSITRQEVTHCLRTFRRQLELESKNRHPTTPGVPPPVEPSAPPPSKGLYLDDRGRVWIDGAECEEPPSALEYRLLETLYHRAGTIVSNEDLMQATWYPQWAQDGSIKGQDEINLRKLIARLRNRLEPGSPGSSSRFIKNARGRGYWLELE